MFGNCNKNVDIYWNNVAQPNWWYNCTTVNLSVPTTVGNKTTVFNTSTTTCSNMVQPAASSCTAPIILTVNSGNLLMCNKVTAAIAPMLASPPTLTCPDSSQVNCTDPRYTAYETICGVRTTINVIRFNKSDFLESWTLKNCTNWGPDVPVYTLRVTKKTTTYSMESATANPIVSVFTTSE